MAGVVPEHLVHRRVGLLRGGGAAVRRRGKQPTGHGVSML